jgi:3-phosphoshikimate 1-carboxyvinyltransferase
MQSVEKIRNRTVSVEAPPSKAHTLRALIIGSLAQGRTTIEKPLLGQDQLNVIGCLEGLGTAVERQGDKIFIEGGVGQYSPVSEELDVGESGVGMNFLTSVACLCDKHVVLTGSSRIKERPIGEVVNGLRQLGAKMEYLENDGFPPIRVHGGGIEGGTSRMHGQKSSQYFSSVCISAPYARREVTIECVDEMMERPYLDISLQMMSDFGAATHNKNYKRINIPRGKYRGRTIRIEGDYSSASFFFLAAATCGGSVTVTNLRADTKQGDRVFVDLMKQMGCNIEKKPERITVEGNELKAIERDMSDIPDLVPPAAIACAFAEGVSRLTNIGHLRHKECDRLAVVASELQKMGVQARCDETSLTIEGNRKAHGATIDPHNDHRIAMSFAVAGLVTGAQQIENPGCVAKSFPDFWERFEVFHK